MSLQQIVLDFNPWWPQAKDQRLDDLPFRRVLQPLLLKRLADFSCQRALVLRGPRQVGKTVILRQIAADLLGSKWPGNRLVYFDFSDDRLGATPTHPRYVVALAEKLAPPGEPVIFLFDEAQYVEDWDRYLKQAVDRSRTSTPHRFLITGSASLALVRGGAESGLGRWDEFLLEPCTFREFLGLRSGRGETPEEAFARAPQAFEIYLSRGGFPEYGLPGAEGGALADVRARLRQDITRAVLRDLFTRGTDLTRVRDLLVYIAQASGLILDKKKCADDLHADLRTVASWVQLLKGASLVAELPRWSTKPRQRMRSWPKLYAVDHGLVVAFSTEPDPLTSTQPLSAVHETLAYRHLRALEEVTLSFVRRDDDQEIDFLVETGQRRIAIEVTASREPKARKVIRLAQEAERVGADHRFLIHPGLTERTEAGVTFLPTHRFLMNPERILED